MSYHHVELPACRNRPDAPHIATLIAGKAKDLGEMVVRRVLPSLERRSIGPFIFFDHMGPTTFEPGQGIDVRPHPHINLATVTYLFEGEILHRDSLGFAQPIQPGAINWMTAGRGIVHSERTRPEVRASRRGLHGIQAWLALPRAHEETEPAFVHHPVADLPVLERPGVFVRLLAGEAFGMKAPVKVFSSLFYAEARLEAGASLGLSDEHGERGVYVVEGTLACGDERVEAPHMIVFDEGGVPTLRAETDVRLMLLGGEPLDGPRQLWWNFVSSRPERIEQAKRDWREERFPTIPGDDRERIPLPE